MGLFTIDRTINFDEFKVKNVIQFINESAGIEEVEDKMIEHGIVSLRDATEKHGFFRRRWSTFLKEFGLYDGQNLTEMADLYVSNNLTTKEFILLFLVNRIVEENNIVVRPLEVLIKISTVLKKVLGDNKIYLNDLKFAIQNMEYSQSGFDITINKIVSARNGKSQYNLDEEVPYCHYDIWKNLLIMAGINHGNSNEIFIDLDMPIVKLITDYYNNVKSINNENYKFNSRFVEYIKLPKKANENNEILLRRQNYKEYYSEIIYKYLFEMSINNIEQNVLNVSENGNIPYKILNGFNISTNRIDKPSNMRLYHAFKGYEGIIINKLRKTGDTIYSFIASSLKSYLDESFNSEKDLSIENPIKKFRDYYLNHLEERKLDPKESEYINSREKFKTDYPIQRIRNLSIDEYALGTENYKETLSYKLEFGEYRHAGPGIGGATASKHGFYKKGDGNFYGIKNQKIDDPKNYWKKFINQLADFLSECSEITSPFRASAKYPLLRGMSMILTKLLYVYYPNKFINICSREKLEKLLRYFNYDFNNDMQAEELNFILNKNIRRDIIELNNEEPQYLGSSLWRFINEVSINEEEEIEIMPNLEVTLIDSDRLVGGYNKIVYGIPGCGKSYHVMHNIIENDKNRGSIYRTTFYPDYTNGDFVGQIVPKINTNDESSILYDIQTGPFTDALLDAILNPKKNIYLVVEEINRGNAAAICGDIFQLLDRNLDGESEYSIKNYVISTYLHKQIDNSYSVNYDIDNIRIPSNMVIIGTMNTSDQNVFTLDTAFKRRWKMEYIQNNIEECKYANELIPLSNVTWAEFVNEINNYITGESGLDINGEDKQIGAYFISSAEWNDIKTTSNPKEAAKIFAEKILSYIWDDVAKINRESWFDENKYRTLNSLVKGFTEKGLEVFSDNISFVRAEQDNDRNQ